MMRLALETMPLLPMTPPLACVSRIRCNVFLMRKVVNRAAGFAYQHSFITFDIDVITSSLCHRFGINGRCPSTQTILRISSKDGSVGTTSQKGSRCSDASGLQVSDNCVRINISQSTRPNEYT